MRLAIWLTVVALVIVGRTLGDERYIAAVAPLVIVALWFGAPRVLRGSVAAVAAVLLATWVGGGFALLIDMLPLVIAALVGWLFARSLLRGREPLIARAIAVIDGTEPLADPAVANYARWLTSVWAGSQLLLTAFGLACIAHAHSTWPALDLPAPRTFALILPLIVCALFIGEFVLRPYLLPQAPRQSLFAFVRALARAWPQLIEK